MTAPLSQFSRSRLLAGLMFWIGLTWSGGASGDEPQRVQVHHSAIRTATGGVYIYVPEKWGILNLEVMNPLDEPRELLSTTYFHEHPTLQFGRRIWVPAKSRLHTWHPVLPPRLPEGGRESFETLSLVLDSQKGDETLTRNETGELLHSTTLPAQLETPITGLIDWLDGERHFDRQPAFDLVVACRVNQQMFPRLANLRDRIYAPDEVSLQTLHQLVVADSRALDDPAGLAAIRRWLFGGGRLWVMLDRVDPLVLERILGDEFRCDLVDRVGLTSVRIDGNVKAADTPAVEFERPVEMARVMASGVDVAWRVNGWPAAFWKTCGSGRLLVTTLGPRAWMRERQAGETAPPPSVRPSRAAGNRPLPPAASRFIPLPQMAETAKEFFKLPASEETIPQLLEPQADDYIGYAIPRRAMIFGLLGGFVAALLSLGTWLLRRQALEHLGWIGPGLAIAVAAILLVIGGRNRHAISATAAMVELVEAIPGTDDIRTRGAVALYNPESGPAIIGSTRGGRLLPDLAGQEGQVHRMVWKDLDAWEWEHLALASGQRLATFMQSETVPERVEARATFGPDGLSGRLSAPVVTGHADALVATRQGRIGVELQSDGRFSALAASVFGEGQFLGAGLLSDEQNQRRQSYARVLPELLRENASGRPLLLLWGDRRDTGFRFEDSRRLLGASLLAIPLQFQRPAPDTLVRIPPPFLPFRNTFRPDGTPSSPLWDHHNEEWQERAEPSEAWLRFQVPAELVPLKLTRARVEIQVTGPVGRVEISGLRRRNRPVAAEGAARDEVVSVKIWDAPVGTLPPADVLDPDLLQMDDAGGLVLGLSAGDSDRAAAGLSQANDGPKVSYWKIERLSLELYGTVSP